MNRAILYFLLFLVITTSCREQQPQNIAAKSKGYIDEVIALLKEHSVKKNDIDWEEFTSKVYKAAKNCETLESTYPVIKLAIPELEDDHSYFAPVNKEGSNNPLPILENEIVPPNIGYVRIPFCVGNEEQTETYINAITEQISIQNKQATKGWIVDLRENFGGNMWPMIAAIGPLLEDGVLGYFIYADETSEPWIYKEGRVFSNSTLIAENRNVISIINKDVKIAVLTNGKTASSGEALAIVFKGLANVKSFGEKTFGVSTGCESFTLSDGSRINLATSIFADRKKRKFGNVVKPDVICDDNIALVKALEWIQKDN